MRGGHGDLHPPPGEGGAQGGVVAGAGAGAGAQVHSPVLGAATQVRRDYTVHSHNKQVNTGNNDNNDNNRTETCSTPPLSVPTAL